LSLIKSKIDKLESKDKVDDSVTRTEHIEKKIDKLFNKFDSFKKSIENKINALENEPFHTKV